MFRNIIFICIATLLSSSVSANTVNDFFLDSQFLVGLSAGPTWASGNQSQTFYLQPDVQKTYTANNDRFVFPTAEIFLAWQKPWILPMLNQPVLGQFGISLVGAGSAKLSGDIWEDADPDFNNFNYQYKVNHTHIALKGRLVGNCGRYVEPYISGSLGIGFNRAYNFTINPNIPEEVPAPPFRSNTTTSFVYTLGIGLQKAFTPQFQAAIGYEFADWGKIKLARANGQTLNQGLALNHLYANQLQFSLFYQV